MPLTYIRTLDQEELQSLLEGRVVSVKVGQQLINDNVPKKMLSAFSPDTLQSVLSTGSVLAITEDYSTAATTILLKWMFDICETGTFKPLELPNRRLRQIKLYALATMLGITEAEKQLFTVLGNAVRDEPLTYDDLCEIMRHFHTDHKLFQHTLANISWKKSHRNLSSGEQTFLENSVEYREILDKHDEKWKARLARQAREETGN